MLLVGRLGSAASRLTSASSRALGGRLAAGAATALATSGAVSFCIQASDHSKNPLLSDEYFPRYAEVTAEHVGPAMKLRLAEATVALEAFESRLQAKISAGVTPSYRELADDGERIVEMVSGPWGVVNHLKSVKDTKELREAVAASQATVTQFFTRMSQSSPIYQGWKALQEDKEAWSALDEAQKRVAELEIRGAELQGIGLVGAEKERFNAIVQELAKLKNDFSNNVLDGTKAFAHKLTDPAQVSGLPPSALAMMATTAQRMGDKAATAEAGPWVATLDGPCLLSILRYADDAGLREKVYRAYVSRASEHGDGGDNAGTIDRILSLRAEQAKLLGYPSYAEVSMAKKMATLGGALELLEDLRVRSFDVAVAEHKELEAYAKKSLRHWDVVRCACDPPRPHLGTPHQRPQFWGGLPFVSPFSIPKLDPTLHTYCTLILLTRASTFGLSYIRGAGVLRGETEEGALLVR